MFGACDRTRPNRLVTCVVSPIGQCNTRFSAPNKPDRFQEEKEIVAMMDLRMAYEGNDLAKFERTLHDKRNKITDDPFVMTYLDPLRQRIRESVLLHLCRPYKKITIKFMAGVSWVLLLQIMMCLVYVPKCTPKTHKAKYIYNSFV